MYRPESEAWEEGYDCAVRQCCDWILQHYDSYIITRESGQNDILVSVEIEKLIDDLKKEKLSE